MCARRIWQGPKPFVILCNLFQHKREEMREREKGERDGVEEGGDNTEYRRDVGKKRQLSLA